MNQRTINHTRPRFARLMLAVAFAASAGNAAAGPCIGTAPGANPAGFRPQARIHYRIVASPDGTPFPDEWRVCVQRAFDAWTRANTFTSLGVHFVPGEGGVVVRRDNLAGLVVPRGRAGGWSAAEHGPDGYLDVAMVWLTANTKLLDSCDGVTKVMLHELGHLHGLADSDAPHVLSVMNGAARKNDRRGRLPLLPSACDAAGAAAASASHATEATRLGSR